MTPDTEHLYRYLVRRVGRAGSIPSQITIAADLGWSTRTVQRRVAELKQLGWLDTDRRVRRGAHGGGKLRAGNAYYPKADLPDLEPQVSDHMPWSDRAATVTEPISAGQTETTAERAGGSVETSDDLNPQVKPRRQQSEQTSEHLTEQKQGEWGTGEIDESESAPAPREPIELAAVLEVGRQHEPSWADLRLDGGGILDRLRAQLGDAEVLSVGANDRPATDYTTARGRVIDLTGGKRPEGKRAVRDLHQAVDELLDHTCRNGAERCMPGQSQNCGRHTSRRRAR